MEKKTAEEIYNEFIRQEQRCPACGEVMHYVGGSLDWICPKCETEGSTEYDDLNEEYYIKIAHEYTYEEIFQDPIGNMPDCCRSCDNAYPDCVIACPIFDK